MSQRKLSRQLTLWEGPDPPSAAPSLASPLSPLDAGRSQAGSALFRRMKLNRSIQERRRSYQGSCSYRFAPRVAHLRLELFVSSA